MKHIKHAQVLPGVGSRVITWSSPRCGECGKSIPMVYPSGAHPLQYWVWNKDHTVALGLQWSCEDGHENYDSVDEEGEFSDPPQ